MTAPEAPSAAPAAPGSPGGGSDRVRTWWPVARGVIAVGAFVLIVLLQGEMIAVRIAGVALVLIGTVELFGTRGTGPSGGRLGFVPHALVVLIGAVLLALPSPTFVGASRIAGMFVLVIAVYHLVSAAPTARVHGGRSWVLASSALEASIALLLILAPSIAVVTFGTVVVAGWAAAAVLAVLARRGQVTLPSPPGDELRGLTILVGERLSRNPFPPEDRRAIDGSLFFEGAERTADIRRFAVMLSLSTAIATFGLLQSSTAVVIGAMLVAPLMTPILGLAAAVVTGRPVRAVSSAVLVAVGAAGVVALAAVLSLVAPGPIDAATNPEIQARTAPNLLDLLVALAAGAAGAFATGDRKVAAALPGVAIAVALVPPLSVVGICLAAGLVPDAVGALVLFLTNFVAIVSAGALVLVAVGYGRLDRMGSDPRFVRTWAATLASGVILLAIPLAASGAAVVRKSQEQAMAARVVDAWLTRGTVGAYDVVAVTVDADLVQARITASAEVPPVTVLQAVMSTAFGRPVSVSVAVVAVERSTASPPSPVPFGSAPPGSPSPSASTATGAAP